MIKEVGVSKEMLEDSSESSIIKYWSYGLAQGLKITIDGVEITEEQVFDEEFIENLKALIGEDMAVVTFEYEAGMAPKVMVRGKCFWFQFWC